MRRERFDKINVVPFIDIVLVLLVIVLATATFAKKKALNIDLPASSLKEFTKPKSISISISLDGKFFYENKEVTLEEFEKRIDKLDRNKDIITIETDQKTDFQNFVTIMSMFKEKKFEKLSIITK